MATVCFHSATFGQTMVPMLTRRRILRGQKMPFWGSDGQTMLPRLANLWVKSHRRTRDLYAADCPERASAFQARLNRRLYDRYHDPVAWDVAPPSADTTS